MNARKSFLIIATGLAVTTVYLSSAARITDAPVASTTGVGQTQTQEQEQRIDAASDVGEQSGADFLPGISAPTGVDWKNTSVPA